MNEQSTPNANAYHRPQQTWVCGRDCNACQLGPTRFGNCRDQANACRPKLSLRGQRGLFVIGCTLTTVAVMLIGTWQTWQNDFMSPGELTSVHQQATHDFSASGSCDACHDTGAGDLVSWLQGKQLQTAVEAQSNRCLKCHDSTFANGPAFAAHNIDPQQLAKRTQAKASQPFALGEMLRVKLTSHQNLACSTCHLEHQGAKIDLTTMTDRQCQACHQQYVHSFESNHPEFRIAEKRRTRIAFDHASHINKHFPAKQKQLQCAACHVDDVDRNVKLLASFEQTCAQCHQQPIQAALTDGVVALAIPTLNLTALKAADIEIGSWPSSAEGDFDGTISSFTLALLQADESAAEVFNRLGYEIDFAHIPTTSREDLETIATLAWAYKRLLHELAEHPNETLRTRLEKTAGRNFTAAEWEQLARLIPPALFREAQRQWFPQLAQELAKYNETMKQRQAMSKGLEVFRNEKPNGQQEPLANNPLTKLMIPAEKKSSAIPGVTWWNQLDIKPKTIIAAKSNKETPNSNNAEKIIEAQKSKGVLLAVNPMREAMRKQSIPLTTTVINGDQEKPMPVIIAKDPPAIPVPVETTKSVEHAPDTIDLITNGAWYMDANTLSIRYRPRGHADEWLQRLLDVTSASTSTAPPNRMSLFAKALSEMGTKSCASCHSIDRIDEAFQVNWKASQRDTSIRGFTNFSHRPHTSQPQLQNCQHCHALNPSAQVMLNYDAPITKRVVDDFHPLQKSSCVACHSSSTDGGRCTMCHGYHVGAKKHPGY